MSTADATITTRLAGPPDFDAILAMLDAARGLDASPEQRARDGFVQGHFDAARLARSVAGPGVLLAEADGVPAGVLITSEATDTPPGPPRETVEADRRAHAGEPGRHVVLYGPVVVADAFRGRGVLRVLIGALHRELAGRYTHAVLFVERDNHKSLAVHEHLGMTPTAQFEVDGRTYLVLEFPIGPAAA